MSVPHCSNNPNIPCLCLFHSEYGTNIATHHPTRTKYGEFIDRAGSRMPPQINKCTGRNINRFQTPQTITCGGKGCCGGEYVDIYGPKKAIDMNHPYALVINRPQPLERYFQTKERAVLEAPRCGDWQIIHLPTGHIIYEPSQKC